MNPRSFIQFFQRPAGRFVGFLLLFAVVLGLAYGCRAKRPEVTSEPTQGTEPRVPQKHTWPVRPVATNRPSDPVPATPPPPPAAPGEAVPPPTVIGIHNSELPPELETSAEFLPYGRMLPCVLVFSAETSQQGTPLIGLVTEDVCFNGRVVVPRGSEVHGRGLPGRVRDRIVSDGTWIIVWPGGEELVVTGMALHQARDTNGAGWQRDDGSPGLRGEVIKPDQTAELKLFGAAFLSGAAEVFKDRRSTLLGEGVVPNARNSALAGGEAVLQSYAQQIAESIQTSGPYVQVIGGTEYYVYLTQTLDRSKATLAGSHQRLTDRPGITNFLKTPKNP